MTGYEAALFLRIVGLTGMSAGIGVTIRVLLFARRAKAVAAVRAPMLAAFGGKAIPVFSLLLLVTGVYVVESTWRWDVGWAQVSLTALVILFAMGSPRVGDLGTGVGVGSAPGSRTRLQGVIRVLTC